MSTMMSLTLCKQYFKLSVPQSNTTVTHKTNTHKSETQLSKRQDKEYAYGINCVPFKVLVDKGLQTVDWNELCTVKFRVAERADG